MKYIISICALLPLILLGCSDDDPHFAGFYQATHETANMSGCDADGAPVQDTAFFRLEWHDVEGQSKLAYGSCDSPDPEACQTLGLLDAFCSQGDQLVRQEISMTYGIGSQLCTFRYTESVLTSVGPDKVRIEERTYSEDVENMTQEQCSRDEAIARGTTMPCVSLRVLEGTQVAD